MAGAEKPQKMIISIWLLFEFMTKTRNWYISTYGPVKSYFQDVHLVHCGSGNGHLGALPISSCGVSQNLEFATNSLAGGSMRQNSFKQLKYTLSHNDTESSLILS